MTDSNTDKPVISELQLNHAVHVAGQQAEAEARASGISGEDAQSLLDGAGGLTLRGFTFPAVHPAYLLMLGKIDKMADKEPLLNTCGGKLVSAFLLGNPKPAKGLLDAGDATRFAEAVMEFMEPFDIDDVIQIDAWIRREFARLHTSGEDEAPKKS